MSGNSGLRAVSQDSHARLSNDLFACARSQKRWHLDLILGSLRYEGAVACGGIGGEEARMSNTMAATNRFVIGSVIALCIALSVAYQDGMVDSARSIAADKDVPHAVSSTEVADLKRQIELQRASIEALEAKVDAHNRAHLAAESKYTSAWFQPTSEGYQRIDDAAFGTFAVSIANVVSYGDGTKLTTNIGNPFLATYVGGKLAIIYGRKPDEKRADPTGGPRSISSSSQSSLGRGIRIRSFFPVLSRRTSHIKRSVCRRINSHCTDR